MDHGFNECWRAMDGIGHGRRTNRSKPKLMYLISEDWFFCSHFMERALAARDAGYDVVVMARERTHGAKIRAAGLRLLPANFARSSLNPVREIALLLRIYLAYRRERPDVLHHIAAKPILYGTLAALASLRNSPIVNAPVGMGYVFSSRQPLARVLRPLLRVGYRLLLNPRTSRVIFENLNDARELVENGYVRQADSIVIRGAGVDVQKFRPTSTPPPGPPVVALVGRMLRDKGVYEFVEAAHRLHDAGSDARFVLIGAPDFENPASIPREELRCWHGHRGVEWWGRQEDMVCTWHQVHIACLPSYREGLPKALLEAAACGLPIVTTDAIGCREVVQNRANGFLVPVGDVSALAAAVNLLICDAGLRERMGRQSRMRAVREFSSGQVNSETLAVYRSLVGGATVHGVSKPARTTEPLI